MSNPHYSQTANPISFSRGRSQAMRDEFGLIEAGFDSVESAMALLAPKASPTFTGTITAAAGSTVDLDAATTVTVPTVASVSDSSTKAASTAFVQAVLGASGALLPPQTTHSGKFLYTNGTSASWEVAIPARVSDRYLFTSGGVDSWQTPLPIGSIIFAPVGTTMPSNWLVCDGSTYTNATYATLAPTLNSAATISKWTFMPKNPRSTPPYRYANGYVFSGGEYSADYGETWQGRDFPTNLGTPAFPSADGNFYAIVSTTSYRSTTPGGAYPSYGTVPSGITRFEQVSGANYVGWSESGGNIAYSTNTAVSFISASPSTGSFVSYTTPIFVGTTLYLAAEGSGATTLQKSTNGGGTWTAPSTIEATANTNGAHLVYNPTGGIFYFYGRTSNQHLTASSEAGPWSVQTGPGTPNANSDAVNVAFGYFFLTSSASLFRSSTAATGSWSTVTPSGYACTSSTRIHPCGNRLWVLPLSRVFNGVSRASFAAYTTDGTNWTVLPYASVLAQGQFFEEQTNGYITVQDDSIFLTASGIDEIYYVTTTTTYSSLSYSTVVTGNTAYSVGAYSGSTYGLIKSTDNGATWSQVGSSLGAAFSLIASNGVNQVIVARTGNSGYFYSDGTSLTAGTLPGANIGEIGYIAGRYFTYSNGANTDMYVSADGINWVTRAAPINGNATLGIWGDKTGSTVWLLGSTGSVYYSKDYGVTWTTLAFVAGNAWGGAVEYNGEFFAYSDDFFYQLKGGAGVSRAFATGGGVDYVYSASIGKYINTIGGALYVPLNARNTSNYSYKVVPSTTQFVVPDLRSTTVFGGNAGTIGYINAL